MTAQVTMYHARHTLHGFVAEPAVRWMMDVYTIYFTLLLTWIHRIMR